MSSKVDTILQKATTFEKLALYGDRKAYLRALAQASLPDVHALITAIDAARMSAVKSINDFWRQDAASFPMPARLAYSALAFPQTDIRTATGEQLTSAMDQLTVALTTVYRTLVAGDQRSKDFAQQTVYPALDGLQQKITQYKAAAASFPPVQPEEEGSGTVTIPEVKIPGQAPGYDPATVKLLQSFLNNALKDQIIAGQRGPLLVDGKLGPDTTGALQAWAKANNILAKDVKSLINTALQAAKE